jgi:hypothetical protein
MDGVKERHTSLGRAKGCDINGNEPGGHTSGGKEKGWR